MTPQKNKSTLEWYYKHREIQIQKMKLWRLKNQERVKAYRRTHHIINKSRINQHKKEYRLSHPEKMREYRQIPNVKERDKAYRKIYKTINREKIKIRRKKHSQLPEVRKRKAEYWKIHSQIPEVKTRRREQARIRNKLNPKSNRRASYDLQDSMNNVRQRDKQTCQWQGCGLTFREAPIHVHHIFPKSEYPDLELVEQYLICYCGNHHAYWHRMRGDPYHNMIYPSQEYMKANPEELLLGGD